MTIGVSKKADVDKMVFRPFDPPAYGLICPQCQKRYGEEAKVIDVVRCSSCPPFHASGAYWYGEKNKRAINKLEKKLNNIKNVR